MLRDEDIVSTLQKYKAVINEYKLTTYTEEKLAYSKSFLSIMTLILRCILYPRSKLFVTSGGKEQASGIMQEKTKEICTLIPAIEKEIDWRRGQTLEGKDYAKYIFKNGSYFDNIAARESSRGKRRHAGLIEECVGVDGDVLNQVIIPTMNISRMCMDGTTHPEEQLNKAQLFITTAGYKNSFAKLKRSIGELKPLEPQNEGVNSIEFANSESILINITLCQAALRKVQRLSKTYFIV